MSDAHDHGDDVSLREWVHRREHNCPTEDEKFLAMVLRLLDEREAWYAIIREAANNPRQDSTWHPKALAVVNGDEPPAARPPASDDDELARLEAAMDEVIAVTEKEPYSDIFCARCDPQTVLRLVERVRAERERAERAEAALLGLYGQVDQARTGFGIYRGSDSMDAAMQAAREALGREGEA